MKLWELFSAFRSEKNTLISVLRCERWREPYLQHYTCFDQLVAERRREVLDAFVPIELSREVAARSGQRFCFGVESGILRQLSPYGESYVTLTALEVHDRFGGSIIEEVLEYGLARINDG